MNNAVPVQPLTIFPWALKGQNKKCPLPAKRLETLVGVVEFPGLAFLVGVITLYIRLIK